MAARYIERNPVRAKLVVKPWYWQWSTAKAHISHAKPLIKIDSLFDFIDMEPNGWQKYIEEEENVSMVNSIRKHTQVGRPLGDSQFIERLSNRLGIRFPVLTRGRPKKNG